jgi:hypothetical protein
MNWARLIGLDEAPSSAASTLAKHGASLRRESEWQKKRDRVVQLCAEMGRPVPDCFR